MPVATDIEVRQPLAPLDAAATKTAIAAYQSGLAAVLDGNDMQVFTDRHGNRVSFVKRSGWRKIALWCDLSIENRGVVIERDDTGAAKRTRVIARASAPNGRFADGEGACDRSERGFSKPEHDLLATAATRAVNRAVSNLVGLGAISAEEVDGAVPDPDASDRPYGPEAPPELLADAQAAITKMWPGVPGESATDLLAGNLGYMPEAAARAIKGLEWLSRNEAGRAVAPVAESEPVPPAEQGPPPADDPPVDVDDVDIDAIFNAEGE